MRTTQAPSRWNSFEWAVMVLLAICAALLAFGVALLWSYSPPSTTIPATNTTTKNQAETEAALLGLKE